VRDIRQAQGAAMTQSAGSKHRFWRIDLGGLVVIAALTGAAYLAQVQPILAQREEARDQAQQLVAERTRGAALDRTLRQLASDIQNAKSQLSVIPVELEPTAALNQRLTQLGEIANQSNVQVDRIESENPLPHAHYQTVLIHLNGQGKFLDAIQFLENLRDTLGDCGISRMNMRAQTQGDTSVAIQLDVIWYAQSENSPRRESFK
jgi:Tfp pilus assembly protein PilO